MKIFSWNVRGAGRRAFIQQVCEFINVYQPDIIFLMESKVNSNCKDIMFFMVPRQ